MSHRHKELDHRKAAVIAASFVAATASLSFGGTRTATWIAAGGGPWHSPSSWSISPAYPGDTLPPGVTYDVVLPAHTSPYTVSVETRPIVDTLDIGAAATVEVQGSRSVSVTSALTIRDGGRLSLFGGRVIGGTIRTEGSGFADLRTQGWLQGVTLDGRFVTDSYLEFLAGSTLGDDGVIQLRSNSRLEVEDGALNGTGRIKFSDGSSVVSPTSNGSQILSLPKTITVDVLRTGHFSGSQVVSSAAINVTGPLASVSFGSTFVNHGNINVTGGGQLFLAPNGSSDGNIRVADSSVSLYAFPGGTFSARTSRVILASVTSIVSIRSLDVASSTILFTGGLNLAGQTASVVEGTNLYEVGGGLVSGGTFNSPTGAALNVSGSSSNQASFSDMTVDCDVHVNDGAILNLQAGMLLAPGREIHMAYGVTSGFSTQLTINPAAQFGVGSRIVFDGTNVLNSVRSQTFDQVTVPNNLTLMSGTGSGSIDMFPQSDAQRYFATSFGTLRAAAAGKALNINGGGLINMGVVEVDSGATMTLTGQQLSVSSGRAPASMENRGGAVDIDAGGLLSVLGSYNDLARSGGPSTLSVTLDAGSDSGRLNVRDVARIDASRDTLSLSLSPTVSLTIGQTFNILTAGSLVGGPFMRVEGVAGDGSLRLAVEYKPTGVLVRATLAGDVDLDDAVDFDDLTILAQQYGIPTGQSWSLADFTGDGATNFDDLVILAQHYGSSTSSLSNLPTAFAADWVLAQSLVPEPTTLVTSVLVATKLIRRRSSTHKAVSMRRSSGRDWR